MVVTVEEEEDAEVDVAVVTVAEGKSRTLIRNMLTTTSHFHPQLAAN